ncbi:MAG: hypothetical protein DSY90_02015 [Deltaproteobacteria bacterium]|nr:MAG: hypothetical protein DSY90_02015 [Deltaproteobacteria bacterium]
MKHRANPCNIKTGSVIISIGWPNGSSRAERRQITATYFAANACEHTGKICPRKTCETIMYEMKKPVKPNIFMLCISKNYNSILLITKSYL